MCIEFSICYQIGLVNKTEKQGIYVYLSQILDPIRHLLTAINYLS